MGSAQGVFRGAIFEARPPPHQPHDLPFVPSALCVYPTGVSTFKEDNRGGNHEVYFLPETPNLVIFRFFASYPDGSPPPLPQVNLYAIQK